MSTRKASSVQLVEFSTVVDTFPIQNCRITVRVYKNNLDRVWIKFSSVDFVRIRLATKPYEQIQEVCSDILNRLHFEGNMYIGLPYKFNTFEPEEIDGEAWVRCEYYRLKRAKEKFYETTRMYKGI